jgi:hypothetical protein
LIAEEIYAPGHCITFSYLVFVGLTPDSLSLGLDTGNTIEDGDGTVKNTKRTLDFDCEIYVSRTAMKSIIADKRSTYFGNN